MTYSLGLRHRGRAGLLALLALLVLLVGLAGAPAAHAADQTQHWASDDVTVQINDDSTMTITERQVLAFDTGFFHGSYRDLQTNRLIDIQDVSVNEDKAGAYRADNTKID